MSELSPETEELLARGREGTPLSTSKRDALKGAVFAKLATGAIVTTSTSAAAWTMTTKTIGVAVIAAVIGTGTVGVVKYQRNAHAPQIAAQTSSAQANPQTGDLSAKNDSPPSPTSSAVAMTIPKIDLPPEPPSTLPVVTPTLDVAPPATVATAHAITTSTPASISNDSPNTTNLPAIVAPQTSSLAEDTALIRAAKQALDENDPARALRLLDEHASRFPSSALEPEESSERVFAFCAEQRTDSACAAAKKFLSAHPTGPLASRVRASCGGR